jgi:hypothetical protein
MAAGRMHGRGSPANITEVHQSQEISRPGRLAISPLQRALSLHQPSAVALTADGPNGRLELALGISRGCRPDLD